MTVLHGNSIFLSASYPLDDTTGESKRCDVDEVNDAAISVVEVVLGANGRVIYGGHPKITAMILMIAAELDAKGSVDVYQSRCFDEQLTRYMLDMEGWGFGRIHMTPQLVTEEQSTLAMRKEMLSRYSNLTAGVFIGGTDDVLAEYELFKKYHPNVPGVAFVGAGGEATQLPLKESENLLGEHVASKAYLFLASMLIENLAKASATAN